MDVILVNEQDQPVGTMEKMEVHQKALLHRAFSVFLFNDRGEMLLHKRADSKYHSGGLWTNACCSHPRPGEDTRSAAEKRLQEEMGIVTPLTKAFDLFTKRRSITGSPNMNSTMCLPARTTDPSIPTRRK